MAAGLAGGLKDQFSLLVQAVRPVILAPVSTDLEQTLLLVLQFPVHLLHDFLLARAGLGTDAVVADQ
jgi:hypothetical protein